MTVVSRIDSFSHKHYVPIIKGKPSELASLLNVKPAHWVNCTPMIDVPPIPNDWPENGGAPVPKYGVGMHIAKVAHLVAGGIPRGKRFFVDTAQVAEHALPDGSQPIAAVVSTLRAAQHRAVPVVGLRRSAECLNAAKAIKEPGSSGPCGGFCVRLTPADLSAAGFPQRLDALLEYLGVEPVDVDLVADYGMIPDGTATAFGIGAVEHLSRLPRPTEWCSLAFAATAMPINLSGVASDTVKDLARHERLIWRDLLANCPRLPRLPAFGDYVATCPKQTEINPRILSKAPSIKYAGPDGWVVAKGKAQPKKKRALVGAGPDEMAKPVPPDSVQYPTLAKQIMDHPHWRGESFSWGGERIVQCVSKRDAKKKATGSSQDWIAVATTHHLAIVAEQIASLPDAE